MTSSHCDRRSESIHMTASSSSHPYGLHLRLIPLLALVFCFGNSSLLSAQAKPKQEPEEKRSPAEVQREINKYLYGPKVSVELKEYERENPGKKEDDFFRERAEYAGFGKQARQFSHEATGLVRSRDALGWSIEKEIKLYHPGAPTSFLRASVGTPLDGDGFVLVDPGAFEGPYPESRHEHTIKPDFSYAGVSDLSRFIQVNSSLFKDIHLGEKNFIKTQYEQEPTNPELSQSDIILVTGAHMRDGTEIVTLFDLRDSAETGALHGQASRASSKSNGSEIEKELSRMLSASSHRRVYYYGDELKYVNIRKTVESSSHEFLRRCPTPPLNLFTTDKRLRELENRKVAEDKLTVVNGLPDTPESVASMGLFPGDADDWLSFRKQVEETLGGRKAKMVTTDEDFISELKEGESDILILVAHSTGTDVYFNGTSMSIEKLRAAAPRTTPSRRPRIAVLVSCETGKPVPPQSGWRNLFMKQVAPLAQILVEKGYVDKVVAPDHNIRGPESLTVLKRALDGARATSIFKNWINWAALERVWSEFSG
jgi:hypothetical protein